MKELMAFYNEYKAKSAAYNLAIAQMYFDEGTIAPENGKDYTNQMISILSGEYFAHITNPDNMAKLEELYQQADTETLKKELALLLDDLSELKSMPKQQYIELTRAIAESEHAWHKAKAESNYQLFLPHFKKVVEMRKMALSYNPKRTSMSDYDIQLNMFERGTNKKVYDAFFAKVKSELLPLIKKIASLPPVDDSILFAHYDVNRQAAFMAELNEFLQVDPNDCYMGTTEHPFTTFFSTNDVRITTHYYEDSLMSAIFSTIHEYGHARYGLQVNHDYDMSTLYTDIGSAMHESQSRFLENYIGRSKAFWTSLYPKFQNCFEEFSNVSLDEFIRMINNVKCSLIRTEADELTYPIHVLIRYEMEKQLFDGELDMNNANKIWADKYAEYLGVRPQNDKEGILQDVHWSEAYLGYFPTYAMGSAYAAQFYDFMKRDFDVESALKQGQMDKVYEWQKANIHRYGALYQVDEIMQRIGNEKFNPDYYINYLKDKYTKLYNL